MVDADALLIEDYNKGTLTPVVIELAMTLARKRGLPVVVDPKFRKLLRLPGATVFKPNRRELEQAVGASLDLDHPDALPTALDQLEVDNLLLTLARPGWCSSQKTSRSAASPRWRARCSTYRARVTP